MKCINIKKGLQHRQRNYLLREFKEGNKKVIKEVEKRGYLKFGPNQHLMYDKKLDGPRWYYPNADTKRALKEHEIGTVNFTLCSIKMSNRPWCFYNPKYNKVVVCNFYHFKTIQRRK